MKREMRTGCESSLARSDPESATTTGVGGGGRRGSGHRWPGPTLRPKRSALRAPQGCAPDQADKTGMPEVERDENRRSWCFLARDFSRKAQAEEKSSEHRTQKGDISIEVRQGTFLSSFDSAIFRA